MRSLKIWIITKLGGYPTIDDAIEAIKAKPGPERTRVLTLAVKHLFNTIGADDILQVHPDGTWTVEGKPIPKVTRDLLVAEATQFLGTTLWRVLQTDIKYQANRKIFILATDEMQLTAGKLWTYTFDALRTRLNSLQKGSGDFNTT